MIWLVVVNLTKTVLSGDAAVTCNRGKTKHVYDFTATCDWKLSVMESSQSAETVTGTIILNDITSDKDYEFEVSVDTSKKRPSVDASKIIQSHVKAGKLQKVMADACNIFYDEFKLK